jgi:hypothetical protein
MADDAGTDRRKAAAAARDRKYLEDIVILSRK